MPGGKLAKVARFAMSLGGPDRSMTTSDDTPRIEQALAAYLRWQVDGEGADPDRFLAEHGDLRDLLEPMLAAEDGQEQEQGQEHEQDTEKATEAHEDDENRIGESEQGERTALAPSRARRRLGDFRLIREVGRGGMGVVFEAEQISLGRRVALKILPAHLTLSPAAIARFRREAETAARLGGAGLVDVHLVGSERDVHYYAMEFVEGAPLDAVLAELRDRPFESLNAAAVGAAVSARCHRRSGAGAKTTARSRVWSGGYVETVVDLVAQVAEALARIHELAVVHRDVKPSNVLVCEDGSAVLTDFGLARDEHAPALTMTGDFVGTPHYVAPEQAEPTSGELAPSADVFALGATLYELVTRQRAFDGKTTSEILHNIVHSEPRDPQRLNLHLSDDLAAVTLKALEKDPARRYPDGAAFARDLRAFLDYRPVEARRASPVHRLWRWVCRNRARSATAAAFLVTVVVSVAWTLYQNHRLGQTVDEMRRLSDGHLIAELTEAFPLLPAARDEDVAALRRWHDRALQAVQRRALHEATLAALRERAEPYSDADRERDRRANERWEEWDKVRYRVDNMREVVADGGGTENQHRRLAKLERELADLDAEVSTRVTWRFADQADQWAHDTLAKLIEDLDEFTDPATGPFTKVGEWLEIVPNLTARTIEEPAAAWKEAIADIADPARSPWYHGLDIAPQLGLVPLGRDPDTGLWEFGQPQTGTLPQRGADGRLVLTDDFGLVFVLLPGGRFDMGARRPEAGDLPGAPNVDPAANVEESPVQTVELDPFLLSKFEMTKAQWQHFTGRADGQFRKVLKVGLDSFTPRDPIETVHWVDSHLVMQALGLALPTEAQWEYAARGGTTGVRWCGPAVESLQGAENLHDRTRMLTQSLSETDDPATWKFDDKAAHVTAVGRFRPNPFGLHDVLGNVQEWCVDTPCSYRNEPEPGDGRRRGGNEDFRMVRGGAYGTPPPECRVTMREIRTKWTNIGEVGLRPARALRPAD